MKLYMHPCSAASRAVSLFAAESGIALDTQVIDLMSGEHCQPKFLAINPLGMVPVLADGDFRLTESSAILKYLAENIGSPAYPVDLRERARINEVMDWFNANLYRDLGYNLVYPQLFDHHARRSTEGSEAAITWGGERTRHWLNQLDTHIIGPDSDHVCLDRLTIADYLGISLVTLADAIRFDFSPWPNVVRWIASMKALESWEPVNAGFDAMTEQCRELTFLAA